jgi:hypothetical protein
MKQRFFLEKVGSLRARNLEAVQHIENTINAESSIIDWIDDGCEVL